MSSVESEKQHANISPLCSLDDDDQSFKGGSKCTNELQTQTTSHSPSEPSQLRITVQVSRSRRRLHAACPAILRIYGPADGPMLYVLLSTTGYGIYTNGDAWVSGEVRDADVSGFRAQLDSCSLLNDPDKSLSINRTKGHSFMRHNTCLREEMDTMKG
ncbi:hypothetical protein NQZ68_008776 [Dissostichus eleginoides]|nr:hypothetical protein NQZ68_008776 [Dissostichus eleginoides]